MVQNRQLKILIYLTGGQHWMGGIQYTRNLLRALALLPPNEQPPVVLQISHKNRHEGFDIEFQRLGNVVIDGPLAKPDGWTFGYLPIIRKLLHRVFGYQLSNRLLESDTCTVAFPAKGPKLPGPAQQVYWIPDFQYKHFPEYFAPAERNERDKMYAAMLSEPGILVLSSEAALEDFRRFFPEFSNKPVRILRFTTTLLESEYSPDAAEVCARHQLPERFVYLPNQMWQHKGFDTAYSALGLLKAQGLTIPLVCTGSEDDYRNTDHGKYLLNLIKTHGLESQIRHLGLLDRQEQLQIFRRAALILQPSRFEGWSTCVEDARALGKRIVLSNIPVHQEQDPHLGQYFKVGNAESLASVLSHAWPQASPGPNPEEELHAKHAGIRASENYARRFLAIMHEAATLPQQRV